MARARTPKSPSSKSFVLTPGMHALPLRCRSIRRIKTTRRDWLRIVRTGWYRSVHVKSFDSHRARALLGARTQLIGMTTRLSNHIRGVLKTFPGLLPGRDARIAFRSEG